MSELYLAKALKMLLPGSQVTSCSPQDFTQTSMCLHNIAYTHVMQVALYHRIKMYLNVAQLSIFKFLFIMNSNYLYFFVVNTFGKGPLKKKITLFH